MAEPTRTKQKYIYLKWLRRISQLVFLGLFFFLFIKTDYTGSDTIEYAVNIFFRLDPLLALCTIVAGKVFIALMIPALIVLVASLIVGRSFCGWFCPMGTLLDSARTVIRPLPKPSPTRYPHLALIVFLFILISSFLGFPIVGYIDPFSLLVRAFTQAIYPALNSLNVTFFTFTYDSAPPFINMVTEPLYGVLKQSVLPFEQKYYELAILSFMMFVALFLLEFSQRRFFCRNLCPLGALIGLVSRYGILNLAGGDTTCGKCRLCSQVCRMGAVDENRSIQMGSCNLCMTCLVTCPRQIITFKKPLPRKNPHEVSLSRRQFIGTVAVGALVPAILPVRNVNSEQRSRLIRPPGARAEHEFLDRCVRCAECIQVCIGNALHPAFLQSGIEGIFTPYLLARTGYCEFNCTLCGQVCPTGAIQELSTIVKQKTKIGHAWFDKNLCLPYAKGIPCIVCEEHCPTPQKAIMFRKVTVLNDSGNEVVVKQPYIVDELCIGCGICETKCPVPGRSAVIVTNAGEERDPDNLLPAGGDAGSLSLPY